MVNLPTGRPYAMGLTSESIVIGTGWKLRRSAGGPKDALTEPGWTMPPKAEGAPRAFGDPNGN